MFLNFYGFQAVYISYKSDIRVVNGLSISEALKSRPVFRLVAKTYILIWEKCSRVKSVLLLSFNCILTWEKFTVNFSIFSSLNKISAGVKVAAFQVSFNWYCEIAC